MDKIKEIVTIAGSCIPLAIGLLTFLIKFIRNEKAKNILKQTLRITEALQPMIVKAEEFTHYTGAEKKQYVITMANRFALDNRLSFDAERVGELIDELVDTTKRVNGRPKDKINEQLKQSVSAEKTVPSI